MLEEKVSSVQWKTKPNITRRDLIELPKNHGSDKKDQSVVVILALLLGSSVFSIVIFFLISSMAFYNLYCKKMKLSWNIDRTLATNVRNHTYNIKNSKKQLGASSKYWVEVLLEQFIKGVCLFRLLKLDCLT